jgi:CRP-like cAMP-binding protein
MSGSDHLDHLSGIPLLARCSRRELELVARAADEIDVDAGAVLTEQGQLGREAFVVVSGTAEIVRDGERIAVVGPGECVGELALLNHGPRTATVIALEPMTVLVIASSAFTTLLDDVPGLTRSLLTSLADRVARLDGGTSA